MPGEPPEWERLVQERHEPEWEERERRERQDRERQELEWQEREWQARQLLERLMRQAQLQQQLEAPPGACTGGLSLNHLSSLRGWQSCVFVRRKISKEGRTLIYAGASGVGTGAAAVDLGILHFPSFHALLLIYFTSAQRTCCRSILTYDLNHLFSDAID
ncbi:hypothetical protein C8R44DRAFT_730416 [Mycena epipterygia]|nr:hypothetical protein C8R44DRAFT_730416 [Mycena epipterygia]